MLSDLPPITKLLFALFAEEVSAFVFCKLPFKYNVRNALSYVATQLYQTLDDNNVVPFKTEPFKTVVRAP